MSTSKKSGRGNSHGLISEVSTYFTVKPGHEEEARAACRRFGEMLRSSDPKDVQKTGLRDARLVVFDDGRRLMFASGFETDWDPYVDDAILIVGIQHFLDWLQHTVEAGFASFAGRRILVIERKVLGGLVVTTGGGPTKALREAALHLTGFRYRALYGITEQPDIVMAVERSRARTEEVSSAMQNFTHSFFVDDCSYVFC
jgi:hypothetical protein